MEKPLCIFENVDEQYNARIDNIRQRRDSYLHMLTWDVWSLMLRPLIRVHVGGYKVDCRDIEAVTYVQYWFGYPHNSLVDCIYYTLNLEGKLHSFNDEPAMLTTDGDKYWYKNGLEHRDIGPALVVPDGVVYKQNGKLHRVGGPARICYDGEIAYYENDQLHNLYGPAFVDKYGVQQWYWRGFKITDPSMIANMWNYDRESTFCYAMHDWVYWIGCRLI